MHDGRRLCIHDDDAPGDDDAPDYDDDDDDYDKPTTFQQQSNNGVWDQARQLTRGNATCNATYN
eukprot:5165340-Lingulodinium_polyedra.AAC.1